MIKEWQEQVKGKIKETKNAEQEGFGLMDVSTCANQRDSWKKVPHKAFSLAQKMLFESLNQPWTTKPRSPDINQKK